MKKILAVALFATTLTACQTTTTAPVLARVDATFDTTGTGKTKAIATQNALTAAKKQCGLKNPIVIKDDLQYRGVLGEETDRLINKGAAVLGAVVGSKIPNLASDDDYEYSISFKCQ